MKAGGRWAVTIFSTSALTAGVAFGILDLPISGDGPPIWSGIAAAIIAAGGFSIGAWWAGEAKGNSVGQDNSERNNPDSRKVIASGPGSVAVGGNSLGNITTGSQTSDGGESK